MKKALKQNKQTNNNNRKKKQWFCPRIEPGLYACQVICPDHWAKEENTEERIENITFIEFSPWIFAGKRCLMLIKAN